VDFYYYRRPAGAESPSSGPDTILAAPAADPSGAIRRRELLADEAASPVRPPAGPATSLALGTTVKSEANRGGHTEAGFSFFAGEPVTGLAGNRAGGGMAGGGAYAGFSGGGFGGGGSSGGW